MNDEMNEKKPQDDIEFTGEDNVVDPEVEDIETATDGKLKKLQAKLKSCESEKLQHLEDLQRAKAEFLNSKKRLEEEKQRDKERVTVQHIEKLLPLADSFHMAMSNTEAWEAIDPQWRTGVEAIKTQLQSILKSYDVVEVSPLGEEFDPNIHEAMTEISVDDEKQNNKIVSVIQNGYVRTVSGKEDIIRPARVGVGVFEN